MRLRSNGNGPLDQIESPRQNILQKGMQGHGMQTLIDLLEQIQHLNILTMHPFPLAIK